MTFHQYHFRYPWEATRLRVLKAKQENLTSREECGGTGWQPYAVQEGRVDELLSVEEQFWLRACWQALARLQTQ